MTKPNLKLLLPLLLIALTSCTTQPKQALTYINEYPTQDRVEFVLQCIKKNGGLRYETLYSCNCSIDKIASQMSFEDYTDATTYTFMRSTPGEKGGIFRDPPQAKKLRDELKNAQSFAQKSCFIT